MAGITTISFRARYLTLLPWLLAELYASELERGDGKAVITEGRLAEVLARLKFVVLVASATGNERGESGNTFGVLGSDLYVKELAEFKHTGKHTIPSEKGLDVYGTYVMPCRGFGLLTESPGELDGLPIAIAPRGREVWNARAANPGCESIRNLLLDGGLLTREHLNIAGRYFSVNGLVHQSAERDALADWMFEPYRDAPDVTSSYSNFTATAQWAASRIPDDGIHPADLIAVNFRHVVTTEPLSAKPVELAWMEYELRRRAHFACELLLADVTGSLQDRSAANVDAVVARWMAIESLSPAVRDVLGMDELVEKTTLGEVLSGMPSEVFLKDRLRAAEGRNQAHGGNAALYGLALLLSCYRCTERLRAAGVLRSRGHYMERAFELVTHNVDHPIRLALRELALHLAVEPHLTTTLRKMGQGQKCSLRFFPEAEFLQPTGIAVAPGFSGSRLGNVLGMLADVGLCNRLDGGRYSLTDAGRSRLLESGA